MTLIPNTGLMEAAARRRNLPPLIAIAFLIVAVVAICAIFGAALAPYAPETQRLLAKRSRPLEITYVMSSNQMLDAVNDPGAVLALMRELKAAGVTALAPTLRNPTLEQYLAQLEAMARQMGIDPAAMQQAAGAEAPKQLSDKLPTDVGQLLKSGSGLPGLGGAGRFPGLPGLGGGFVPKKK